MKLAGARKQTMLLTGVNGIVRALGLLMRVILSRGLGAEVMGIAELAQSVHMIAITPLTSGLPAAVSRMTAKAAQPDRQKPLQAGLWLSRIVSAALIPLLWLISPWLARLMGDLRVLPSLWFTAPCILILGYSASYNGFCYGMDWAHLPAFSELIEQAARLLITIAVLFFVRHLTAPWLAAVPAGATMIAEILGLLYIFRALPFRLENISPDGWRRPLMKLALPTTFSRMLQTVLRSTNAILIPLRLQSSGLSTAEATARLGMFNGMIMPVLMLPCVFTSALSMVAVPRLSRAEDHPQEFSRLIRLCLTGCLPAAVVSAGLIYLAAPLLSNQVYRQPELTELFRLCAPMTMLFALSHLCGSVLSALGQQKASMLSSCAVSVVSVMLTWLWAGDPALRLLGVIRAQYISQLMSILSGTWLIAYRMHQSR